MAAKIYQKNKPVFNYGVLLFVLVIGVVFIGQYSWKRFRSVISDVQKIKAENAQLLVRDTDLKKVKSEIDLTKVQSATFVLPSTNPVLRVIAQIRGLAAGNSIVVDNINMSPPFQEGGLSNVTVGFDVESERYETLMLFIKNISVIAPVTNLKLVRLERKQNGWYVGSLEVASFWSPFPETLPSITETLSKLTPQEEALLNRLAEFKEFVVFEKGQVLVPLEVPARPNPFEIEI